MIFGTGQLVLLPFAALLINLSLARNNEAWRSARRVLLWTAGLPLFGFLSFAVYSAIFVFPLGPDAYGPGVNIGWPPRFAFLSYMLWVVILSWQAIRCSREGYTEIQAKGELTMGKGNFTNVDEYISAQPETAQVVLQLVRSILRRALPGPEEAISYKIPAYRLHGGIVLYLAGWKQHYSLYPAGERMVAAFKDQLASYKVTKGTIRFPLCEPVPVNLIERIAKFRAEEAVWREQS
jgi:uncharacterized protein YdhG (YjbR/CyaY superfamily)